METKAFAQETETDCWKENAYLKTENAALLALNKELKGQIEALMARVLKLTQQVYGRKSEQQSLQEKDSEDGSPQIQSSDRRGQREGAQGHGRRQYTNLPVREEIHAVSEANRQCPHCGLPYDPFPPGEETSVEIDWRGCRPLNRIGTALRSLQCHLCSLPVCWFVAGRRDGLEGFPHPAPIVTWKPMTYCAALLRTNWRKTSAMSLPSLRSSPNIYNYSNKT